MKKLLSGMFLCLFMFPIYAATETLTTENAPPAPKTPVTKRVSSEKKATPNSFVVAFHKPTYILPFYYTGSPYNSIYAGQTPENQKLKHLEVKYQLSFKVPLWKNIHNYPATLYLAYTQLSYWQAYNKNAFFRETDYEPEIYLSAEVNRHLFKNWTLNFLNIGLDHQSNGFGGELERSWNRAYIAAIASNPNWMVMIKPWLVFQDATYRRQNPNLTNYLGYGQLVLAYKYKDHVFSVESQNLIESMGKRAGTSFEWSFPLATYLKGYIQFFTGYGQSLIEYDHHTNSVGVGIALSNWV